MPKAFSNFKTKPYENKVMKKYENSFYGKLQNRMTDSIYKYNNMKKKEKMDLVKSIFPNYDPYTSFTL